MVFATQHISFSRTQVCAATHAAATYSLIALTDAHTTALPQYTFFCAGCSKDAFRRGAVWGTGLLLLAMKRAMAAQATDGM